MAFFKLSVLDPYASGKILEFRDGVKELHQPAIYYQQSKNDQLHEVVDGDELDLLAVKYYNDGKLWWILYVANRMLDPQDLPQYLVIPNLEYFRSRYA